MINYERETTINFNDDEKIAYIYTLNQTWKTKLKKLCAEFEDYKFIKEDELGACWFEVPKKCISANKPRFGRELTEDEKEKLRENLRKYRENKNAV
jgi:hypothetical protein